MASYHTSAEQQAEHALNDAQPRSRPDGWPDVDRRELVQLAHRFLWDRSDAEDAVQDALALAHERRHALREPGKLRPWLKRIVVRRCLLMRRGHRRRAARERLPRERPSEAPADRIAAHERVQRVRWAIGQLPPQQRTAVTLRHLEEMSYEDVAAIMEISPSTARVHVRAAREAIRRLLVRPEGDRRPRET